MFEAPSLITQVNPLYRQELPEFGDLLTAQEEISLGRVYREAIRARSQLEEPSVLSGREVRDLIRCVLRGSDAFQEMITMNLRLVIWVARRYHRPWLLFDDIVQEGNLGLIRGLERWDPDRGYRLTTYVTVWVHQAIRRFVSTNRESLYVPSHVADKARRVFEFQYDYYRDHQEWPTYEQIGATVGITSRSVESIMTSYLSTVSLDPDVDDEDGETSVVELIPQEDPLLIPELAIFKIGGSQRLDEYLSYIKDPRDRDILVYIQGLDDDEEKTFADAGREFGISRERARKLHERAIGQIRVGITLNGGNPNDPE